MIAGTFGRSIEEFPDAIQLISDISLGHFAKNGMYDLINPTVPTYVHSNGCQITKMNDCDGCGSNLCTALCCNGACYKAFCPQDQENLIPSTLFIGCDDDGPQTCTIAEYATYEDYDNARSVENTNNFKIEGVQYGLPNGLWVEHRSIWIVVMTILLLCIIFLIDIFSCQFLYSNKKAQGKTFNNKVGDSFRVISSKK